ncbi:MAG: fumarate hydratase, partial [Atribacterota bacterium]
LRNQMMEVLATEQNEIAREMVSEILENYMIAEEQYLPLCQDTGMVMAEIEIGNTVIIEGGTLQEAVDEACRRAYHQGYFRKSIISDPLFGGNTGDNAPGVVFIRQVRGETLRISLFVKGGGCDNISTLWMMKPGSTPAEVERVILRTLDKNAARACPPLVVGIGMGGNAANVMILASRAMARPLNTLHPDERYRRWEKEWKDDINKLGIGPQGVGGLITCLDVRIESAPCHIASFPVGMVCSCHVFRQIDREW